MNSADVRILIVDDEPDLRELYTLSLVHEGWQIDVAASVAQARDLLLRRHYALMLTDMRLPDGEGLDLLRWLEAQPDRHEKSIVITAYGSAGNAVAALKAGAFDYLSKPVDLAALRRTVHAALATADVEVKAPTSSALQRMVGESGVMRALKQTLQRVARSMAPVLIHGESGTGKELAARAVHECSARAGGPFVPVNCSAIPEQLLEAEFFGYRKGAFTGAMTDHAGFFAAAQGGTLFLDEIGELPLAMQAKLLRAVQERRVRPVGETAEVAVDVRLVSATHRHLERMVEQGQFRQDLFYRLNVIAVSLPPLRERLDDLPVLVEALLADIRRDNARPGLRLSPAALQHLRQHRFPGNVRELENLLHRAAALAAQDLLGPDDIELQSGAPAPVAAEPAASVSSTAALPTASAPPVLKPEPVVDDSQQSAQIPMAQFVAQTPLPPDLGAYLDQVERSILCEALRRTRFNRTAAAQLLGLNLRQIRYRMERLDIRDPADAPDGSA
ncbi:sigma-54-dependent transcriptional regulator [Thiomonas bhubaneswarensis]|uniref:DNA-binding transcriptional response regulator, NtrC family, contains REC, AAA-type ATPase, and a Fis-type DNA-binding domains n=1 Tax=Thiomonas bhubaneswarensis TaxID=339866 RepID=A0A0K6HXQ9_9BURK|nr:sigma-54 dependent transcriptional regulator [Thiomonas bhubaneswarensis]CUA95837.1 DNA-binding transcriptional response regulator, NtrC family, contains REC, AAA-type ATPase, and a Fis-type DNA-binding domains [Thiomonas bhubaneswarensis]